MAYGFHLIYVASCSCLLLMIQFSLIKLDYTTRVTEGDEAYDSTA